MVTFVSIRVSMLCVVLLCHSFLSRGDTQVTPRGAASAMAASIIVPEDVNSKMGEI